MSRRAPLTMSGAAAFSPLPRPPDTRKGEP
jgi:hypothetical protein